MNKHGLLGLMLMALVNAASAEIATFAMGCFWCVQADFDQIPGIIQTTVGYTGGTTPDPTYEQVSSGNTAHREAIQIEFDPQKISYQLLLQHFWQSIDPVDDQGQFCDKGPQYRSAIFYHNDAQKQLALASKAQLAQRFTTVATDILPAMPFYPAENYHQKYYQNNPVKYQLYRFNCSRDRRLQELWGG